MTSFDFGRNWEDFSRRALTETRVAASRDDFRELLEGITLENRTFLDVGYGQGLGLLSAAEQGAQAVGVDINPLCEAVARENSRWFPSVEGDDLELILGSILEDEILTELRAKVEGGAFDVVHSWGVLHHTGDLHRAIRLAAGLVAPSGYLVLAVYQTHWSSGLWKQIKRFSCRLPLFCQRPIAGLLLPVLWLAKLFTTGQNPNLKRRGMSFYYDTLDWVGGYPYEYASRKEIKEAVNQLGFECQKERPASVPTGCNEFVFRRRVVES